MKIIDLTHPIAPDMPVYPGTEQPIFITGCSIDEIGFLEKKITLYSHTGTHIDAPAHIIKGAKTLDMLPVAHFYGKAIVLNFAGTEKQSIGIKALKPHQEKIKQVDFLLIHSGWSHYWGTEKYFTDYHVITIEAAQWLSRFDLKGLGLDTISADEANSEDFSIHKVFLNNDTIIIENLVNLDKLMGHQFFFSCLPLSFEDADGSPVRAVALIQ